MRENLGDGGVDRNPEEIDLWPDHYRPFKEQGSPVLIAETPKNHTGIARIRVAIPAQLRAVENLLGPKSMELPDTVYAGTKLAEDPRYGEA